MVVTRSQSRHGAALARINHRIGQRQAFRKRYRPNDTARRHRLPDRQRKSVRVVSYSRRS
jgi:hypothetical protein